MGLGHDLLVSAGDKKKNNNYLMIVVVQNNNEGKDMIITKIKN